MIDNNALSKAWNRYASERNKINTLDVFNAFWKHRDEIENAFYAGALAMASINLQQLQGVVQDVQKIVAHSFGDDENDTGRMA